MSDKTAYVIGLFQEELTKYSAYVEYFDRDMALVFHGLAGGPAAQWTGFNSIVARDRHGD
jgi:hypothetical protein